MDIEVARGELTRWRVVDPGPAPLDDGEARLRVDRFGFSSNNVSYAVIGDMLRYWEAFPAAPADDGDDTVWGRVPVWGSPTWSKTRSPDVAVGERLFGFLPMSTELVIVPGRSTPTEVVDTAGHRAVLAGAYNGYRRCAADPVYRADAEELQMLLYPLFFTSFVIDDFLADHGDFGGAQAVVSSASAKTALGAAYLLHGRGVRTVALTSSGNADFCRSLGVYDQVVTYDAVDTLDQVPSVFIDVSGDQGVVSSVHLRLGDGLAHSMIVGDTHWDSPPADARGLTARSRPGLPVRAESDRQAEPRVGGRRAPVHHGRGLGPVRRLGRRVVADRAGGGRRGGHRAVPDLPRRTGRPQGGYRLHTRDRGEHRMKFGIVFANTGPFCHPSAAVAMARAAEAAGFESLWTVEHTVVPDGYESEYPYDASGRMPGADDAPIPDPLIWLAYLASATSSIRLGTGILIQPQRNPVVLAKEVATLDELSGGRMELGVGVGWLKEEFDAIGVPFGERGRRTDDGIAAMRALWGEDRATYEGEFTSFSRCISRPQPVSGAVPVHVGGHSEVAARRPVGSVTGSSRPRAATGGWASCSPSCGRRRPGPDGTRRPSSSPAAATGCSAREPSTRRPPWPSWAPTGSSSRHSSSTGTPPTRRPATATR